MPTGSTNTATTWWCVRTTPANWWVVTACCPTGAVAAGGLYTATEFDIRALDSLRPSLVEMGRAVVRQDHRNGAVVLLMWAGILAYLDRAATTMSPAACRSQSAGTANHRALRFAGCGTSSAPTCRSAALPGASAPAGDHRRAPARRHPGPRAAEDPAADARLPAARRANMRRAGPRCRLRGGRLPRAAGQAICPNPQSPAIPVGVGGQRSGGRVAGEQSGPRDHAWLPRASCDTSCCVPTTRGVPAVVVVLRVALRAHWRCCWRWRAVARDPAARPDAGEARRTAGWSCAASASGSRCRVTRFAT